MIWTCIIDKKHGKPSFLFEKNGCIIYIFVIIVVQLWRI